MALASQLGAAALARVLAGSSRAGQRALVPSRAAFSSCSCPLHPWFAFHWEITVCTKTAALILSFFLSPPRRHPSSLLFSLLSVFWLNFHSLHRLCIAGRVIQPWSNHPFQHLHIFVYSSRSFLWPARMNSGSSVNLTFYLKYGCWSHLFFLTIFFPLENPRVESWLLWIYWQTGQQLTSHIW